MNADPGSNTQAAPDTEGQASTQDWPSRRGMRGYLLVLLYAAGALIPIALATEQYPLHPNAFPTEIASALGLAAFGLMLVELVLLSRYRWISDRIGIDRALRFHRCAAYAMVGLTAFHPLLYAAPEGGPWPWFSGTEPELGLGGWPLWTGLAAWILIGTLVVTAIDRNALPWRYEIWRRLHAGGSLLVAVLVAVHAFTAGGYSTGAALGVFWVTLLAAAAVSLLQVYLIEPWLQKRAPYVVEAIDRIGAHTWALRLRPRLRRGQHSALRFRPGQFAWLKLGRRALWAREHPFSMSTAPEEAPTIGFTIKEKGDFTDGIGDLAVGSTAYIDGPHGHFVPDEDDISTVYIAGGTGIGPIMSHLRAFRARGDPRELTLIYGVHTPEHIVERDELAALTRELNLTVHYVVRHPDEQWQGAAGVIDRDRLLACLPATERAARRYFVCGPEPMKATVKRTLRELGIPPDRIVLGA